MLLKSKEKVKSPLSKVKDLQLFKRTKLVVWLVNQPYKLMLVNKLLGQSYNQYQGSLESTQKHSLDNFLQELPPTETSQVLKAKASEVISQFNSLNSLCQVFETDIEPIQYVWSNLHLKD